MAVTQQILLLFAILALIHVQSVEMTVFTDNTTNSELQCYKDFLTAINAEENFENCLFYGEPSKSKMLNLFLRAITEHFWKPVIIQSASKTKQEIANRFSSDMLIIAQIGEDFETELSTLASTLERMRQKRIIIINTKPLTHQAVEPYLRQVFLHCESEKLLNVVGIFKDFPVTKIFHSYHIFPKFALEMKTFGAKHVTVFPRRMQDLQGFGLRTVPDQMFPWSFTYELDNQVKISGYLQKVVETYAKYKNATLSYAIPVIQNDVTAVDKIVELMKSNKLDIPASLKYSNNTTNFEDASRPLGFSGLFIITPIMWRNSFSSFLGIYGDRRQLTLSLFTSLSTIVLFYFCRRLQYARSARRFHKNFFAALLEPSYLSGNFTVKYAPSMQYLLTIRLITCVSAVYTIFVCTQFTANLNTFMTKPATARIPQSWDDLNEDGQKVLVSNRFYNYLRSWCDEAWTHSEHSLVFADSSKQVRDLLLAFNTSYAYPTDQFTWYYIKLQMRKLKQPIFRQTGFYLKQRVFHCFLLPRNSIFKESLDLFLLRIADHGLEEYWVDLTYMDAVRYDVIPSIKHPDSVLQKPLGMEYISFMWPLFGFAWTLAFCTFAVELVSVRWRSWVKKIR
ncbi:uncharacterized protein LOC105224517 [Bactrocera dorsalis]|uniref:Uncharacterized protein LOC105224517 n=1 Tax=Bactrocera dorsalis TaxID=27457 RepID=A0A6I9UTI4_BACDO|nr:uncharacterized protein LOC105224517 [Bactrocera dorsalis]